MLDAWLVASLPWLGAALLIAAVAGVVGVYLVLRKLGELERFGERLDALEEIRGGLSRFVDQRGDLDLRRIEHALLEIAEGQKRLESLLVRTVEGARATDLGMTPARTAGAAASARGVADRVIDRLLVLGYERIQLVTPLEELSAAVKPAADSEEPEDPERAVEPVELEVLVEAHRNGVLCKGRARVRDGALVDVDMKPAYTAFP